MTSQDGEPPHVSQREYAVSRDAQDPLSHLRKEFHIPTKAQVKATSWTDAVSDDSSTHDAPPSIYLCGNSLGLQPKVTAARMQQYLQTWATQGVYGHFKPLAASPLPPWLDADTRASESMAPVVGALPSEVAVMETLTANLHLLMSAFYKPEKEGRHKIIMESQAFPSDHFAAESQIRHHNLSPSTSLITIEPAVQPQPPLSTELILSVIEKHAAETALILLPGIQFYTGQLLDIKTITAFAHQHGIFIIWDLAHAAGNVPLSLHDWDVDAAVWCSYKYLNSGPGAAGGFFVHERNSTVTTITSSSGVVEKQFIPRLSGWWGSSKTSRFAMDNRFIPIPGAAGFQLSNPSILDLTSLRASLEMFSLAGGIGALRERSLRLTAYLEKLLLNSKAFTQKHFSILTPSDPSQRGAQLSLKLEPNLLDDVMLELEARSVVVDERRPDVIRVAPAPLYNNFEDCWLFVDALEAAIQVVVAGKGHKREEVRELSSPVCYADFEGQGR